MTARRLANPRNVPAARQGIHPGIVPDSAAARSLRRGSDREIARPPDAFAPDRDPMTGARIGGSVHHAACRAVGRGICAQPRHLPGQEALFASVWRKRCSLRHGCATVCRQTAWFLHAHYVPATNPHHGTGNFIIPGGDPCDNTAPAPWHRFRPVRHRPQALGRCSKGSARAFMPHLARIRAVWAVGMRDIQPHTSRILG